MQTTRLLLCLSLLLPATGRAAAPLRFALSEGLDMPLLELVRGQPARGIVMDVGAALGQQLGREVQWRVLPRKRLAPALTAGEVDLLCSSNPAWLQADVGWSQPLFANSDIIVVRAGQLPPASLAELAGKPLGTLLGFRYPVIEQTLGAAFRRDDAANPVQNARKLQARRVDYMVSNEISHLYQLRHHAAFTGLNPRFLRISHDDTRCALSRRSPLNLPALDAAIGTLHQRGILAGIMAAYR